jgi:hypothetical protein
VNSEQKVLERGVASGVKVAVLTARFWRWLLFAGLVGGILGYAGSYLLTTQWEAVGYVRIGRVGLADGRASVLIEPAQSVAERLKVMPFLQGTPKAVNPHEPKTSPPNALFASSLKGRAVSGTDLVEVRVRSDSPASAREHVQAVARALAASHEVMGGESLARLRAQRAALAARLTRMRASQDEFEKKLLPRAAGAGERDFMPHVVATNILVLREAEMRRLEDELFALDEAAGPLRTYPTALIEDVSVGDRPVAPRRYGPAAGGALISVLLVSLFLVRRLEKQPSWRTEGGPVAQARVVE